MALTLTIISIVALALALAFLIAAAVIFVKLKIWIVMDDLSGKTAQQSVERLRNQTGKAAPRKQHRSYVVSSGALKRNKGTAEIRRKKTEQIDAQNKKTYKLREDDSTSVLSPAEAGTEILETNQTSILQEAADTALLEAGAETMVLSHRAVEPDDGTTVLSGGTTVIRPPIERAVQTPDNFVIVTDIVMIHTDEHILLQNDFH